MSNKRRSDSQLTKDDYEAQMNGNFSFPANHTSEGREDAVADPSKMADSTTLLGRKILPMKKGRGRGGAAGGSSRGGGSSIPNFFAATPTGGFGANGTSQPDGGVGAFSGFGTPDAAPTAPSFGGNATGGFGFGGNNNAPEQPKVNPFGSLVPTSSTANGGGMFGSPQLGGPFGGRAPQNASTGGMFGSNNNNGSASPAPVSGGFTFGGTNSNASVSQPAATGFNKAPSFNFGGNTTSPMFGGDNKPAASASFAFGANNDSTPAVAPPVTTSFTFGSSTTTATAPAANADSYFGAPNPAPEKTPEPQATPAVAAPTFSFGAATPTQPPPPAPPLFGKPADSQGKPLFRKPGESPRLSLFGKPAESQGSPLFGRPSPSPEPTSTNLFAPPKPAPSPEPTANGLFGPSAPAPAPVATGFFGQPKEQNKPLFGGFEDNKPETPKQEAPKSLFGGFGDNKSETPKQPFFGGFGTPTTEKIDEPSKPLFDFGIVTEKKQQEPTKEAPKVQPSFSYCAPSVPAVEKKDDDVMDENPSPPKSPGVFDQLTNNTNSFSGFGVPKFAVAPSNQFTPPPMFAPITINSPTTTSNARTPSPPLPSDATLWTIAQLTEYYNLFALRALNHSFLDGLKKADQMGDWSANCGVYIKESEKIKDCQQNGERYKGAGAESKPGSGIHGKRSNSYYDDNKIQGGGGKRSKGNGEDSKPSGSDSSKALASIIGGSTDAYELASKPTHGFAPPTVSSSFTSGPELASAPPFCFNPPSAVIEKKGEKKGGSIFDSPNAPANNGGFVNPFQCHTPDPSEKDQDDEDDEPSSAPAAASSLFDRVSEPKKDTASSGSIFSNSVKSSPSGGLFSSKLDQTWSPDKGVRFSETNGTNGSIFGPKSDAPKSLFGSPISSAATSPGVSGAPSLFGTPAPKSEVGFSFGGNGTTKPSGPISIPGPSAMSTPDGDSSEPNDNAHLAKNELDLSAQGPGEEDEDSQFQIRAIIYEVVTGSDPKNLKKAGVGTLRVLKNRITGKARVITRTESGKVVLNVGLVKEVAYGIGDKGGKSVSMVEFLPEGKSKRYSIRVKEEEDAKRLGEVLDVAKLS